MLNLQPPPCVSPLSPPSGSPASPNPRHPTLIRRRSSIVRTRGGQPFNRNALKHGLFARKNPTSLTRILESIRIPPSGSETIPAVLNRAIPVLREQMARLFESQQGVKDLRSLLARHRPLIRLQRALARHQQPQLQLQFTAAHALDLIRYEFHTSGITRDADSFREKKKKSDFNCLQDSSPSFVPISPCLFLTHDQWAVLEPLIPPSDHIDPRGRPPADPHLLLDAIFWKFAHHARWQDLPPGSPPMLTCRRYYRRLFLSGRLFTLYSALYKDFLSSAKVELRSLVDLGCFEIAGNALVMRLGRDETWQVRTALLFMQLGFQVSRRILREKEQQDRRCSLPYYRQPIQVP
jgi:hypothetical protein